MRIEPAEQFAGTTGRAPRARGYGESVEALVEEYSPLVRKIAWQVFSRVSRTSELDDLIQTGLIALIEASRHYEERGFAFATYATTRIRGAMIDQLRREADVGRSAMVAAKRIHAMRGALEQQLMRAPTAAEMAVAFDMSAEDYFALERNATHGRSTSLDELTDIGAFLAAAHGRELRGRVGLQGLGEVGFQPRLGFAAEGFDVAAKISHEIRL